MPESVKWAKAVRDTWGKHCNRFDIVSHQLERNQSIGIRNVKAKNAFHLICKLFNEMQDQDFDWVLVVNEKTFVIVENLRYLKSNFEIYLS